ncbi:hypothetical protein AaE_014335 [Aphanomyces astaci]|uniref:Uncharacterized protein n=1 Tax=Aphanomyces astaci TaxID=112090 RepID=A0A6A4Z6Y1_APHAT|nr:hypothetical protein AaE_014335 [Aphanomyces astaci]
MVQSSQSMLNPYILGRKSIPTDRHRPLLTARLQFDSKLGLGLPHIASRTRAQRLQLLQRAMSLATPDRPRWQPLILRKFERCMGRLHRASSPFDFFIVPPQLQVKVAHAVGTTPSVDGCVETVVGYTDGLRIQLPLTPVTTMQLPVWLTDYEPTMWNGKCAARNVNSLPTRRWCSHGAVHTTSYDV